MQADFRIGFGTDTHRLKEGEDFFLGGIKIEHYKGCVAHSDGDALLHAICDALLGAANLRDIGYHFPDNKKEFKNIDSKILLEKVTELIRKEGYELNNLDSSIHLQKPKLKDYIPKMKELIAGLMKVDISKISIKAKTGEKIGFIGREEGISVDVACLIHKSNE